MVTTVDLESLIRPVFAQLEELHLHANDSCKPRFLSQDQVAWIPIIQIFRVFFQIIIDA